MVVYMEIKKLFGEYLSQKRKQRKLSMRLFAKKLGVSFSYLSSIESGQRQAPKYEILQKMVEILGLTEIEKSFFYDYAALSNNKGTIPPDIIEYVNNNKIIRDIIRAARDGKIPQRDIKMFWEHHFC